MPKSAAALPEPLSRAVRRFDRWRRDRTSHRIPEELWSLAADLGARYGVSRTSRRLRIGYYELKKRVASAPAPVAGETAALPAFVEIRTAPEASVPGECQVEFEKMCGAKMRIQLKGAFETELSTLTRLFLEERM
jgi:hypothetical protein